MLGWGTANRACVEQCERGVAVFQTRVSHFNRKCVLSPKALAALTPEKPCPRDVRASRRTRDRNTSIGCCRAGRLPSTPATPEDLGLRGVPREGPEPRGASPEWGQDTAQSNSSRGAPSPRAGVPEALVTFAQWGQRQRGLQARSSLPLSFPHFCSSRGSPTSPDDSDSPLGDTRASTPFLQNPLQACGVGSAIFPFVPDSSNPFLFSCQSS